MSDDPARFRLVAFCPGCFATNEDGSAGEVVVMTSQSLSANVLLGEMARGTGHCLNCGASCSAVVLPFWAVEWLRQNASFVGKRFYPSQEDRWAGEELKRMRARLPIPASRSAERCDEVDLWWVKQPIPGGYVSIHIDASSAADALAKTRTDLPWFPE